MARRRLKSQREMASSIWARLPKRLIDPAHRTKMYIEFRVGMPDPAREARLERMRNLTRRS